MTAIAPQPRSAPTVPVARPRPRERPEPRARAERRVRVASGVVWIVVIASLLAGVVFMNVAVLRANIKLDRLGRDRTQLQAKVASLASDLSSAEAAARIQLQSRQAGFVQAQPRDITYLSLSPKR